MSQFLGVLRVRHTTRLHIYRTFKTPTWTEIPPGERDFIAGGGILFYNIEPRN